jgi:hypothetical protein
VREGEGHKRAGVWCESAAVSSSASLGPRAATQSTHVAIVRCSKKRKFCHDLTMATCVDCDAALGHGKAVMLGQEWLYVCTSHSPFNFRGMQESGTGHLQYPLPKPTSGVLSIHPPTHPPIICPSSTPPHPRAASSVVDISLTPNPLPPPPHPLLPRLRPP